MDKNIYERPTNAGQTENYKISIHPSIIMTIWSTWESRGIIPVFRIFVVFLPKPFDHILLAIENIRISQWNLWFAWYTNVSILCIGSGFKSILVTEWIQCLKFAGSGFNIPIPDLDKWQSYAENTLIFHQNLKIIIINEDHQKITIKQL